MNTVVVGLGNILLRDEGLGVWAIRTIQRQFLVPPEVTMLDGGTLGLDLLPQVEAAGRLLVIDAVQVGCVPGTLVRLTADAISRTAGLRVSPHDVGLPDLLAAAALRDRTPKTVVLWGMEPADLSPGIGLSPIVSHRLPALVEAVLQELCWWGIWVRPASGPAWTSSHSPAPPDLPRVASHDASR